jgi:hypothetical protein
MMEGSKIDYDYTDRIASKIYRCGGVSLARGAWVTKQTASRNDIPWSPGVVKNSRI